MRIRVVRFTALVIVLLGTVTDQISRVLAQVGGVTSANVDFNRQIRPILAKSCFACHGPDEAQRKAELRLDNYQGATRDLGGRAAIVPTVPSDSRLLARISTKNEGLRMPPSTHAARLQPEQIELLTRWIRQGAVFSPHWSYQKPKRPTLPTVKNSHWVRNPIDHFTLAKLEQEDLYPQSEAGRWHLARRVTIDLTGLPPTVEEVNRFVADEHPQAYQRYVQAQLDKPSYGERWARVWLDLARYADSAGYADDPPRTIWAYRDYVIRSLNQNKPFDQFTIEQIAGDLLPQPTEDQLIATAFHRNTMTNNEGGTNDEEFRNEAIVDRVNTTMTVWMGTTIACAQCHSHKYDPISQQEYFQFFAFFNNTEDSDKRDEQPLLKLFTPEQKQKRQQWQTEIDQLKTILSTPTPALSQAQRQWETRLQTVPHWQRLEPLHAVAKHSLLRIQADGSVANQSQLPQQDTYTLTLRPDLSEVTALRLQIQPQDNNFVLSQVTAVWQPDTVEPISARYVQVQLPGVNKILSLAEVEVWQKQTNLARTAVVTQSSTDDQGRAELAIDGNTDGHYLSNSTTRTRESDDPWLELDLGNTQLINIIKIWNRTDGGEAITNRLAGYRLVLLDANRSEVWHETSLGTPTPLTIHQPGGKRALGFTDARADYSQNGFPAKSVLSGRLDAKMGWAVAGELNQPHQLSLVLARPRKAGAGQLIVELKQESVHKNHLIRHFSLQATAAAAVADDVRLSEEIRQIVHLPASARSAEQEQQLAQYYRSIAPALQSEQEQLAGLQQRLDQLAPYTTVPIMRELAANKRRETRIQLRGDFQRTTDAVTEATPTVFHPLPPDTLANRLGLAKWLVSRDNPLTARVVVNRHWEQLFGLGLVRTGEEYGTQGALPSHPELLDWLAVELMDSGWNLKHLLRTIVTSATYCQSSKVTPELLNLDPDNRWFTRGPRFRLSAEMVRDQALFVSGLLSAKMYNSPVNPPQPELGIKAAFGSNIDWQTSTGEDRYRRSIYTNWRRSNPYPSMVAFDAPDRQVCIVRRSRSNTPLQALVTLNDPVYVEAAQSLARRLAAAEGEVADKIGLGVSQTLIRPAQQTEVECLDQLYSSAYQNYQSNPEQARLIATKPLGDLPTSTDLAELAAWTVVSGVLLNLDEIFMKR